MMMPSTSIPRLFLADIRRVKNVKIDKAWANVEMETMRLSLIVRGHLFLVIGDANVDMPCGLSKIRRTIDRAIA